MNASGSNRKRKDLCSSLTLKYSQDVLEKAAKAMLYAVKGKDQLFEYPFTNIVEGVFIKDIYKKEAKVLSLNLKETFEAICKKVRNAEWSVDQVAVSSELKNPSKIEAIGGEVISQWAFFNRNRNKDSQHAGADVVVYLYRNLDGTKSVAMDASTRPSAIPSNIEPIVSAVFETVFKLNRNGQLFFIEGDRMGMSKLGRLRFAEYLLSGILKVGTSKHIAPKENFLIPEHLEDDLPCLTWTYVDESKGISQEDADVKNLAQLICFTYCNTACLIPKIDEMYFVDERGCFEREDKDGKKKQSVAMTLKDSQEGLTQEEKKRLGLARQRYKEQLLQEASSKKQAIEESDSMISRRVWKQALIEDWFEMNYEVFISSLNRYIERSFTDNEAKIGD